jgi:hypothetical protein
MALTFKITPAEVAEAYQRKIANLQEILKSLGDTLANEGSLGDKIAIPDQIEDMRVRITAYEYLVDHINYDIPHYSLTQDELRNLGVISLYSEDLRNQ